MRRSLRRVVTALVALVFPSAVVAPILRLLGHRVGRGCRFGWSLLFVDRLRLRERVVIGHLNLIDVDRAVLRGDSSIGRMNIVSGPFDLVLARRAAIGNSNKILRAPVGLVTVGRSMLRLGELSKITSNHRIDCTRSVVFGRFSILAGACSQIWTHGYVHAVSGAERYRIDGDVLIGDNVYIGSGCIVSMGVRVASAVIVGAGTTVARNLDQPGLWVSSPIRCLPRPGNPAERPDLVVETAETLCESVYRKKF